MASVLVREHDDTRLNSGEFSYDGAPGESSRFTWVLLLSLGMLLAMAEPFLAGRVYTADDLGAFHLPMRAFYADCLSRGEPFDWSPQMYCGLYLTGEGQIGGYHPLHLLLYRWLPLRMAFDVECLASYPFMLVGMFLLLRRWGIRRDAALFGGLTFTFSGFTLLHFVHVNGVASVAHIPWLLLAIHAVVAGSTRNRRLAGGIAMALLTGSQLLLGYPQYVWLSLLAEIGYEILLLRGAERGALDVGAAAARGGMKVFGTLAFWTIIGAMIGSVQLLPTLDALQRSSRQVIGSGFSGWGSLDPLNIVQLIGPYLFKTRVVGQNTHELGLYAGSVTLLLAIWCLARRAPSRRLRLLKRGAMVLAVVGLLVAFGDNGPLQWFISRLPLVNRFRFPCRAIVFVHLGLAILAAIGLISLVPNRCASRNGATNSLRIIKLHGTVVALGVLLALGGPIWWPEHVAAPVLVWTGPALLAAAALLIRMAQRGASWALAGLMLLSAVDLGTYGMTYGVYPQTANLDQYVAAVSVPPGPALERLALDLVPANRVGLHAGNQSLLTGWNRVDGYSGLEPARTLDFRQIAALQAAGVGFVADGADVMDRAALRIAAPGWLRVENSLPRARLVTRALVTDDPASTISTVPLESTALVEQPIDIQADDPGKVEILGDRPGDICLAVASPRRQLLVLAESFHSGWEATVGETPRPVMRVNGDFMGCLVGPGKSEVHFRFRPVSLRYGRLLTILGLSFIAAAVLCQLCSGIRQNSGASTINQP